VKHIISGSCKLSTVSVQFVNCTYLSSFVDLQNNSVLKKHFLGLNTVSAASDGCVFF